MTTADDLGEAANDVFVGDMHSENDALAPAEIDPSPSNSPAGHAISSGVVMRTSVRADDCSVQMATLATPCARA
jgi:hypothetical protein